MKQIKKVCLKEAEALSNEEMMNLYGGSGTGTSCTVSMTCAEGSVSCTSQTGNCQRIREDIGGVSIYTKIICDDRTYTCNGLETSGANLGNI